MVFIVIAFLLNGYYDHYNHITRKCKFCENAGKNQTPLFFFTRILCDHEKQQFRFTRLGQNQRNQASLPHPNIQLDQRGGECEAQVKKRF